MPKEHGVISSSPIPVEVKRKETERHRSSHLEYLAFKRSVKDSVDSSRSLGETCLLGLEIDDKIWMMDKKGRKLHV